MKLNQWRMVGADQQEYAACDVMNKTVNEKTTSDRVFHSQSEPTMTNGQRTLCALHYEEIVLKVV